MTNEMKIKMFEKVLEFEHNSEERTYDNRNYFEMAYGAYQILKILGIEKEYIRWSENK